MRRRVKPMVNILGLSKSNAKGDPEKVGATNSHKNGQISEKQKVSTPEWDEPQIAAVNSKTATISHSNEIESQSNKLNLMRRRVKPSVNVPMAKRPSVARPSKVEVTTELKVDAIAENTCIHENPKENDKSDCSLNNITTEPPKEAVKDTVPVDEDAENDIDDLNEFINGKSNPNLKPQGFNEKPDNDTTIKTVAPVSIPNLENGKTSNPVLTATRTQRRRVKPVANIAKVQRVPRASSQATATRGKADDDINQNKPIETMLNPQRPKDLENVLIADKHTPMSPGKVVEVLSNATNEKDNVEVSLQSIKGSVFQAQISTDTDAAASDSNLLEFIKKNGQSVDYKSTKTVNTHHNMRKDSLEEEERSESDASEIILPNTDESIKEFLETTLSDSQTAATLKEMDIADIINDIENAAAPPEQQGSAGKQLEEANSTDDESVPEHIRTLSRSDHSFKYPLAVKYNRVNATTVSSGNIDDFFNVGAAAAEENVIQMDLQRQSNYTQPMSPSKVQANRQRIRPAPVISQRRNSLVDSMPSPQSSDEIYGTMQPSPRRDKSHLSPYNHSVMSPLSQVHSPAKSHSRTRTESSCSVYSDASHRRSRYRNEDHMQRLDYEARFSNGVPDKHVMKMSDLIFYNPESNPMKPRGADMEVKDEKSSNLGDPDELVKIDKVDTDDQLDQKNVPQLKLNEHGEIILDDTSLEIETSAEQQARKVLANSSLIELDENTGMNGFYKRQKRTRDWTADQTLKFYRCLQTIGTDFSMMVELFPDRTRRDLKLKFKKEERVNNALINKALLNPKAFNVQELKEHLLEEERKIALEIIKWKNIKSKEPKKSKRVRTYKSRADRSLQHGDFVYQNENVTREQFKRRSRKAPAKLGETGTASSDDPKEDDVEEVKKSKRRRKNKSDVIEESTKDEIKSEEVTQAELEKDRSYEQIMSQILENPVLDNNFEGNLQKFLDSSSMEGDTMPTTEKSSDDANADADADANADADASVEDPNDNRTFMNLDDGTLTKLPSNVLAASEMEPSSSPKPPKPPAPPSDEIDESDIQQILNELSKGTLALVSAADPDDPDHVVNEIYMTEPNGCICEKPLDIPEDIINSIMSVIA